MPTTWNGNDILRQLRGCSYEELQEIVTVANSLLAGKASRELPVEIQLAYSAMVQPLHHRLGTVPPLGTLKKEFGAEVRNAINTLLKWLETVTRKPVARTEIAPYFGLFGDLLVRFLDERQVPLSLMALIRQHGSIPGLVDTAFPGYIQSGTLSWVIAALRRPRT